MLSKLEFVLYFCIVSERERGLTVLSNLLIQTTAREGPGEKKLFVNS